MLKAATAIEQKAALCPLTLSSLGVVGGGYHRAKVEIPVSFQAEVPDLSEHCIQIPTC